MSLGRFLFYKPIESPAYGERFTPVPRVNKRCEQGSTALTLRRRIPFICLDGDFYLGTFF